MNDMFDLMLRYLDGTASPGDVRRLDAWLQANPEGHQALLAAAIHDVQLGNILEGETVTGISQSAPRRPRTLWLFATAATVAIIAGGVALLVNRYPAPDLLGPGTVVNGGEVQRGAVIASDMRRSTLRLGGYCQVQMGQRTTVRVGGRNYAEEVFLERGRVFCEADRGIGTFTVRTDVGTVSVKGTKFNVRMTDKQGDRGMFGKRMVVGVLAGAVLVSGPWGDTILHAGQQAALPPPEFALRTIVEGLNLPPKEQQALDRMLSPARTAELRETYRPQARERLLRAAQSKLQTSMPKLMPAKVMPKLQAVRRKARSGPPSPADRARIRLAAQQQARTAMMPVLHATADDMSDRAARDDRLIGWLLASRLRSKIPEARVAAFDTAVKDAGMRDCESEYIGKAEAAIDGAITAYEPDLSGIIDPNTGAITVDDAELGLPVPDEALSQRIAQLLRDTLANLQLSDEEMKPISPLLTAPVIEAARIEYCFAVRPRLFEAARKALTVALPRKMPDVIQKKVMAIRTRARSGGAPSAADIARIQRAATKRTREVMMKHLHGTADALAVDAAKDERLVAAYQALQVKNKLEPAKATEFDAALTKAGITSDESAYLTEAAQRIGSAIDMYDPDLTGIVSPATGKVIVEE